MLCSKESTPNQKHVTCDTGKSSALPNKCAQAWLSAVEGTTPSLVSPE